MSYKDPVKLSPVFKDYIWGGDRLKTEFNKKTDMKKVAESWELSTHKDGESIVSDGEFCGKKLSQYFAENPEDVIGQKARSFDFFPILIKFIDAKESLSIQVHPDDEYSLKNNGEYGKTEMWYILDCEEDSFLYYGFREKITKEEFKKSIENNTLLDILNQVKVKPGDVFFIEAGTVHAIGKGIVICEIQQNSNTTYRVYDYNRKDANGNTRPLHINEAVQVSKTEPAKNYKTNGDILAQCKYFTVKKAKVTGVDKFKTLKDCFMSLIVTEGDATLTMGDYKTNITKGDSIFIPAQDSEFEVSGECNLIISHV